MPNTPPSEKQVKEDVIGFVAAFSNLEPGQVQEDWVLKGTQLALDDNGLAFLAMSLRGYVRHYNPSGAVLAEDVRKKGLTVKALAKLIFERMTK